MESIRCAGCDRLLFRQEPGALAGKLELKCPRCGAMNIFRPSEPPPERRSERRKDNRYGGSVRRGHFPKK